jgi:uncharacterized protein (TIGR04222 family)
MSGLRLAGLLWLALCAATALADERILEFHSDIRIVAHGSMQVTERIRVRAEGADIRRGIYRDFPTDYRDRLGNRYRVSFEIQSLRRDGAPEPYFQERRSNGVRVYAGRADVLLGAGEYVYELRYVTDRQLGFFADRDELYWNVTGNGWDWPIDRASARVELPQAVEREALTMAGYVGLAGSTEQSYRAAIEAPGAAYIESSRELAPREGLTLVLSWPKGVIAEPTPIDRLKWLLSDNLSLLIAGVGFLVTLAYYLSIWRRLGRDPERGVIFPHYEPPEGISPASARHVMRMAYDAKAFTAAVINLAVKGYLSIEESDGDYTLRKDSRHSGTALAPGERALLDALLTGGNTVLLKNKNSSRMQGAMSAHRKSLKRDNYRTYFVTNSVYIAPAAAALAAIVGLIALFAEFTPFVLVSLVPTIALTPLFGWLLKAPTPIGRRLLDRLEGFKLYLNVAEKDELQLRNPPEKTPELFEAYLPFALALGVEQAWAEKFNAVFERLRADSGKAYAPIWYRGHFDSSGFGGNAGAMTAKLASAVGGAIAAAATPPGSASGGSGGGSSGGGGGGGGGGGW